MSLQSLERLIPAVLLTLVSTVSVYNANLCAG